MRFSERKGFESVKNKIQIDDLNNETRIGLWNAFISSIWRTVNKHGLDSFIQPFFIKLWDEHFKLPIDSLPNNLRDILMFIRQYFLKTWIWYHLFDFIEFVVIHFPETNQVEQFISRSNVVLTRELSGYRIVGNRFLEITSEEEISTIETVLKLKDSLNPIKIHIKSALDKLTDRKNPDYRNSIKESISAVETICRLITRKPKATLGQALKKLEEKIEIHPALKNAFNSLYGYTSDEDGIRHSLMDTPNIYFEDAKFMLSSCSSFINYLMQKSSKAKIKLI